MSKSLPVIVVVAVAFLSTLSEAAPPPRILNGGFDLGAANGLALEWQFEGDGVPVNDGSQQIIADVPVGATALLSQVVPMCVPGGVYSIALELSSAPSNGVIITLGVEDSSLNEPSKVTWSGPVSAGSIQLSVTAQKTNLPVFILVANSGDEPGFAYFAHIDIQPVEVVGAIETSSSMTPSPLVGEASAELEAGFRLLRKAQFERSRAAFEDLLAIQEDLTRSQAARALVGLHEVEHSNDFAARSQPLAEQEEILGLNHIRSVLRDYPDQDETCALAFCKLGEFYLSREYLALAKDILERIPVDYDGSSASTWAKVHLVNAHLWSGEDAAAENMLADLRSEYDAGRATTRQLAWAEYFLRTQQVSHLHTADQHDQLQDLRQDIWERLHMAVPEVGVRAKLEKASDHFRHGKFYKALDDYEDLIQEHPGDWHLTGPARIEEAYLLHRFGNGTTDALRAASLLRQILSEDDALDYHKQYAAELLDRTAVPPPIPRPEPRYGVNVLKNPEFEEPPRSIDPGSYFGRGWKVRQHGEAAPNWPGCDWETGAPGEGLLTRTPAWNSINTGRIGSMTSCLVHDAVVVAPSDELDASIYVAAEGWDGGSEEDVVFEISVDYLDRFSRPLGSDVSPPVRYGGPPKGWVPLGFSSTAPAEARYAILNIRFRTEGEGHHAIAMTHARLILAAGGGF